MDAPFSRRRFQFSLRTLFVVVTIACLYVGVATAFFHWTQAAVLKAERDTARAKAGSQQPSQ